MLRQGVCDLPPKGLFRSGLLLGKAPFHFTPSDVLCVLDCCRVYLFMCGHHDIPSATSAVTGVATCYRDKRLNITVSGSDILQKFLR